MRSPPGELVVTAGPAAAAIEASSRMGDVLRRAIGDRGSASMALSGGNTPRGAYSALAKESGIAWSKVDVFWVDERAVAPTDDRSNFRWVKATLLDAAPIPADRVVRMQAERSDREAAASDYERALRERVTAGEDGIPAFDVVVLGIGDDGHTASLFPGEPTIDVVDRLVAAVPARPGREARLTLTAPVIRRAREVVVVLVGQSKHDALNRTWDDEGDVHETPARLIRTCVGKVLWVVDEAVLRD
jgi:6-phosphogluconolactonase